MYVTQTFFLYIQYFIKQPGLLQNHRTAILDQGKYPRNTTGEDLEYLALLINKLYQKDIESRNRQKAFQN